MITNTFHKTIPFIRLFFLRVRALLLHFLLFLRYCFIFLFNIRNPLIKKSFRLFLFISIEIPAVLKIPKFNKNLKKIAKFLILLNFAPFILRNTLNPQLFLSFDFNRRIYLNPSEKSQEKKLSKITNFSKKNTIKIKKSYPFLQRRQALENFLLHILFILSFIEKLHFQQLLRRFSIRSPLKNYKDFIELLPTVWKGL